MNCDRCGKTLRGGPRFPFHTLELSHNQSARTLGISGSTWQDYMCHGVGREAAERIADKLGVHPYELWPELVDHDLTAQARPCRAPDCTVRFVGHFNQRYCSPQCRRRNQARRHRERHRESYRAQQRAWRERNAETYAEYQRRYQRRYMRLWRQRKRQEEAA